jgi:ribosome maturation factor RimP
MAESTATAIATAFERAVAELPHDPAFANVEVVIAEVRPHRSTTELALTLDREGGLDMETVERAAAYINAALEPIPDLYTLEVESAGVDRPLVKPADYDRFAGNDVKIVTTLTIASAKTHRGRLVGLRDANVILATKAGELPLPLAAIKSANIEYDIRADLQRAKRAAKAPEKDTE